MKHQVNSSLVSYRNLGSVRVVMAADGTVEQVNHYYAFGGLMAGSTGAGIQPLKYNGKELERTNGLNLSDYGARWYDAAAPSWLTPDPLADKDPGISPYVYCMNNPVNAIDPDGKKVYQGEIQVIYLQSENLTLSPKASEYTKMLYNGMMKIEILNQVNPSRNQYLLLSMRKKLWRQNLCIEKN